MAALRRTSTASSKAEPRRRLDVQHAQQSRRVGPETAVAPQDVVQRVRRDRGRERGRLGDKVAEPPSRWPHLPRAAVLLRHKLFKIVNPPEAVPVDIPPVQSSFQNPKDLCSQLDRKRVVPVDVRYFAPAVSGSDPPRG